MPIVELINIFEYLKIFVTHQKMKWPISSHNNQAEHHAPCHHAVCQHKLVEPCSDLLVAAVIVGVAPSFAAAAEQERRIVAVAAAAGAHTAAVADSQHYTAAVVVLDRILLERTCWYGFTAIGYYLR